MRPDAPDGGSRTHTRPPGGDSEEDLQIHEQPHADLASGDDPEAPPETPPDPPQTPQATPRRKPRKPTRAEQDERFQAFLQLYRQGIPKHTIYRILAQRYNVSTRAWEPYFRRARDAVCREFGGADREGERARSIAYWYRQIQDPAVTERGKHFARKRLDDLFGLDAPKLIRQRIEATGSFSILGLFTQAASVVQEGVVEAAEGVDLEEGTGTPQALAPPPAGMNGSSNGASHHHEPADASGDHPALEG